jgi:hypothetical protein
LGTATITALKDLQIYPEIGNAFEVRVRVTVRVRVRVRVRVGVRVRVRVRVKDLKRLWLELG